MKLPQNAWGEEQKACRGKWVHGNCCSPRNNRIVLSSIPHTKKTPPQSTPKQNARKAYIINSVGAKLDNGVNFFF